MRSIVIRILCFACVVILAAGCAAKNGPDTKEAGPDHHPKFETWRQFSDHLSLVSDIMFKRELEGEPLDMSWMDPAFREKICLTVTITNHCVACHAVHSDAAKDAGLSKEEIRQLIELSPEDFSPDEHAALIWARNYVVFDGDIPIKEVSDNFEKYYDEKQRRDIRAVVIVMDFANKWNNTMTGQKLDEEDVGGGK